MFYAVGGADDRRPTYFELLAADRLMPSLKAALSYSLAVLAARRPALHRLLDWEDEAFAILLLLLDGPALREAGASFAESLYGLRRSRVDAPHGTDTPAGAAPPPLPRRLRWLSLALLIGAPYLKSKLDALHARLAPRDPLGLAPSPPTPGPPWLTRAIVATYPWAHLSYDGLQWGYQLAYLLGRTPYFSPGLRLLRLTLVRATPAESLAAAVAAASRAESESRARGPMARVASGAMHAAGAYARGALVAAVFGFKLAEWWYTSAESRLAPVGPRLPLPPPPPRPAAHPDGCGLPADPADCPVCRRPRTNAALAAPTGHAYCYPCLHRAVEATGKCPVTLLPLGVDDIRRLYETDSELGIRAVNARVASAAGSGAPGAAEASIANAGGVPSRGGEQKPAVG